MAIISDIAEITRQAANIVTAAAEYKIAEKCRVIESGVTKAAIGLGLLKVFAFLLAAGFGFLLWGLYKFLTLRFSPPASAMLLGGAVLAAGLLVCWWTAAIAQKTQ